MKSDPLASLLRLRRLTADQARRELAECLRAESEAKQAIAAIDAEIARETEVATSLAGGDAEVEAFAAWLRRIRPSQHAARAGRSRGRRADDRGTGCSRHGTRSGTGRRGTADAARSGGANER